MSYYKRTAIGACKALVEHEQYYSHKSFRFNEHKPQRKSVRLNKIKHDNVECGLFVQLLAPLHAMDDVNQNS